MERPAKRPRLLTPLDSVYNASYNNQHAYYEAPNDKLNDYEEPEEEVDEDMVDPDQELQRKRARADFKLKSTFEAIFEKYGKDFGGIGDEIDMRTGEILVNNGHILAMRHEMDAGDSQTTLSEDRDDDMSGSDVEDLEDEEDEEDQDDEDNEDLDDEDERGEEDEEDYDEEDPLSDEEMVEDDMILRGFAQASQQLFHRQLPREPGTSRDRFSGRIEPQHAPVVRPDLSKSTLPSRSEILAQFGPQLGPEIVNYVSKRGAPEDGNTEPAWRGPNIEPASRVPDIEPAWRVPDIEPDSPLTSVRRPLIRSMVIQPGLETERSPSPENAPSIWAVTARKTSRKSASRKPFSPHEDQTLLDFVANARRHGLDLSKISTWKQLEAMNSRRCAKSWKQRYTTKFTYLRSSSVDESDLSTSDFSSGPAQIPEQRLDFEMSFARPAPPRPSRPVDAQRPARVRKPAQRDGVVSWSEAIATIASIDPIGNAGLLDDVRRTGYPLPYERPVPSMFPNRRHSLVGSTSRRPVEHNRGYPPRSKLHTDPLRGAEHELALNGPAFPVNRRPEDKAHCPHANCKSYPTTLYRLERRYDEELSPMCSHLLYEHQITPFPCGESNCERKGARGYFMQNDLVMHVREAHPYASALHRLRGRVDSMLLDQSNHSDQPCQSIEVRYDSSIGKQPRDSDFMAQQRPYTSHGVSSSRRPFLGSDEDPNKTVTPRAEARAVSETASSMHVHPSSVRGKDMPSISHREASSDSDLQILDENPFKKSESSKKEDARDFVGTGIPNGDNHAAASDHSFTHTMASQEPQSGTIPRIPSNFTGGKMISSSLRNMSLRSEIHETRSTPSTAPKESHFISSPPLAATIPNSQSSPGDMKSRASFSRPENSQASRIVKSNKPSGNVESIIDRSYEFSDEEDGIRPAIRIPPPQPSLPQKSLPASASQEPFPAPQKPFSVPQSFFAPPTKVESPQMRVPTRPPATLAKKGSSVPDHSIVTSPAKPRARKFAIHNVLASDEFDELSLGEDGFILLSARSRTDKLPRLDLPVLVKREEDETRPPPAGSTKKRLFSSIEDDNEVDELAENSLSMSTPHQPQPVPGSKPQAKTAVRDSGSTSMRPIMKPKSRKRHNDAFKSQPGSSLRTPTTHHQLPARTSTPILDLANRSSALDLENNGSRPEIPSTSELGSSPNSRRGILAALITPRKKTWAGRAVKLEDENELIDSVVTPGGTLRRCGQDGFVCGRAFCFRCQAEGDAMMR